MVMKCCVAVVMPQRVSANMRVQHVRPGPGLSEQQAIALLHIRQHTAVQHTMLRSVAEAVVILV